MTSEDILLGFGTYLLAIQDYRVGTEKLCHRGDIALVFSKHRAANPLKPYDLLMEKGNTLFGIDANTLHHYFRSVYHDPHTVIDGCSTNFGWQHARKNAERLLIKLDEIPPTDLTTK